MTVNKGRAIPLKRTAKQTQAAIDAALGAEQAAIAEKAQTEAQAAAQRLAQIVNLHIGGMSLAAIGAEIGATPEEVDRMLTQDAARYVRNQPALRTFVRNFLSEKYTALLEANWTEATDRQSPDKLENQDRILKILKEMGRLHGAPAPVQTEITVEAGSETIDAVVARIAAAQGMGFDTSIFDGPAQTIPGQVVHEARNDALAALEQSSRDVEIPQDGDENF